MDRLYPRPTESGSEEAGTQAWKWEQAQMKMILLESRFSGKTWRFQPGVQ